MTKCFYGRSIHTFDFVMFVQMLGSMNPFRVSADIIHLLSFYFLLHKIVRSKNATGISLRSQQITCLVFMCRYQDVIWDHDNLYNVVMKLSFLATTMIVIYAIRTWKNQKETYDEAHDNFSRLVLILPCMFVSGLLMLNLEHPSYFEFFWTFSICLESVSIMPQLSLLMREKSIENPDFSLCSFPGSVSRSLHCKLDLQTIRVQHKNTGYRLDIGRQYSYCCIATSFTITAE